MSNQLVFPSDLKPSVYDPDTGKALYDSHASERAALSADDLAFMRLDVGATIIKVLAVHALTQWKPLHDSFVSLNGICQWSLTSVDGLADRCFATQYALGEAKAEGALDKSSSKMPAGLIDEGRAVEKRMQKVCEHLFQEDPELGPEVARLSPGTGHRDLAEDLLGYARIYRLQPALVATDAQYYKTTDLADAARVAGEILSALGGAMTAKGRAAYDNLLRSFTLLLRDYEETRRGAEFILYNHPEKDARFPSAYKMGRAPGSPRKASSPKGNSEPSP